MNPSPKTTLRLFTFACLSFLSLSVSARYAAIVIDADSGRVVHEVEATHRWYPASLTKVMTIYMTFSALQAGKLDLQDTLTVSPHAARQPNSKLGLLNGQTITVEQAIMAVTTRSANDAAVVLAEKLGGNESAFASMMTRQAKTMGMINSSFQNASGLPDEGQISSARDLALLSASLIKDFPQYYRYFSATEFNYKGRVLPNTNRILKTYPDADGLKTGFTCGSGYNLIASAKRDGRRLIGVLLGAHSSAERFQQMANLLDLGFEKSQAGSFGLPLAQFSETSPEAPPFQLSSNRCAGSAEQMGADTGSTNREKINIKPSKTAAKRVTKPQNKGNKSRASSWSILLGDHIRKTDAAIDLKNVRKALGGNAKTGEAQIVRIKTNGKHLWRLEWTGLDKHQAGLFCSKLRNKKRNCTVLPGNN